MNNQSPYQVALSCLDLLIHREVLRLRAHYQLSLDEFRGLYVSDKQVDALIRSAYERGECSLNLDEINQRIIEAEALVLNKLQQDLCWNNLCERLFLSEQEQWVLLLAYAPEIDAKYEVLYAYLNNDITRKYPTLELTLRLLNREGKDNYQKILSKDSRLRQQGIIREYFNGATAYELQKGYQLSPVIKTYLSSEQIETITLNNHLIPIDSTFRPWNTWPFNQERVNQFKVLKSWISDKEQQKNLVLEGGSDSSAEYLIKNIFAECVIPCFKLNSCEFESDRAKNVECFQFIDQVLRLSEGALIINLVDKALDENFKASILTDAIKYLFPISQTIVILVEDYQDYADYFNDQQFYRMSSSILDREERLATWSYYLENITVKIDEQAIEQIADFFKLDYQQISVACQKLQLEQLLSMKDIDTKSLFQVAKEQSYSNIGKLAQKVENRFNFKDLVLPKETSNRIYEIIVAVRNRKLVYEHWGFERRLGNAKGMMVMFSGSSGTGKTMAAGVIASELNLDLYRIDLSKIVSKYIGDTEKNLDKIFAAAQQANCILFFDEADALFGKRSEVKDAHDRYANVEVAYLLQKMEEHDGMAILTTNLAKNLDQAFSRRLQYIVEFPRPDEGSRERIWKGMFNEKAPLGGDVDFNFLARQFSNTGGDIKNIVLDAAMMAADTDKKIIDMPLLLRASARQMVKQGKVPSASEFKHYFELVNH